MEENKKPRSTGRVHRSRQSTGKLCKEWQMEISIDLFMEYEIVLLGNHEAFAKLPQNFPNCKCTSQKQG